MFDTSKAMHREVMAEEVGLKRQAQDISEVTKYGQQNILSGSDKQSLRAKGEPSIGASDDPSLKPLLGSSKKPLLKASEDPPLKVEQVILSSNEP